MIQSQRQNLIHITITGRGDGTIDENLAIELRMMAFRDVLMAKRKRIRVEDQKRRQEATEALYEADIAKHGHFWMEVWSRDCDMFEMTRVSRYKSINEFKTSQECAWEDAEGPIKWTHISHEEAEEFPPHQRDLIMENREDGGDGYHLGI